MRYGSAHKEATRRRILEVAARRFRGEGIAAVGVAGLMADAGLTHGGFYAHFPSKEDLVRDAVADALDHTRHLLEARAEAGGMEALIAAYLSPHHRDHPEAGCAVAALGPELVRHPGEIRGALTAKVRVLVDLIARHMPPGRQADAPALLGLLAGTLQLARAMGDGEESERMLAAGRRAALAMSGGDPIA